mmetsp:Transcript_4841/g.6733  ORF Transcript_4841/g.6733 Transcript_4841/m.6733 type:complete len:167 (-) Transcript_4841:562-1062(-)
MSALDGGRALWIWNGQPSKSSAKMVPVEMNIESESASWTVLSGFASKCCPSNQLNALRDLGLNAQEAEHSLVCRAKGTVCGWRTDLFENLEQGWGIKLFSRLLQLRCLELEYLIRPERRSFRYILQFADIGDFYRQRSLNPPWLNQDGVKLFRALIRHSPVVRTPP